MERVVDILKAEFDRSFKLINSKTYPVSGGELNPANVDSEIEAFAQLGVSRGLDSKEAHYLANLYGSNAPKVLHLLTAWNKRQVLAWQTPCPFTMQCAMS